MKHSFLILLLVFVSSEVFSQTTSDKKKEVILNNRIADAGYLKILANQIPKTVEGNTISIWTKREKGLYIFLKDGELLHIDMQYGDAARSSLFRGNWSIEEKRLCLRDYTHLRSNLSPKEPMTKRRCFEIYSKDHFLVLKLENSRDVISAQLHDGYAIDHFADGFLRPRSIFSPQILRELNLKKASGKEIRKFITSKTFYNKVDSAVLMFERRGTLRQVNRPRNKEMVYRPTWNISKNFLCIEIKRPWANKRCNDIYIYKNQLFFRSYGMIGVLNGYSGRPEGIIKRYVERKMPINRLKRRLVKMTAGDLLKAFSDVSIVYYRQDYVSGVDYFARDGSLQRFRAPRGRRLPVEKLYWRIQSDGQLCIQTSEKNYLKKDCYFVSAEGDKRYFFNNKQIESFGTIKRGNELVRVTAEKKLFK